MLYRRMKIFTLWVWIVLLLAGCSRSMTATSTLKLAPTRIPATATSVPSPTSQPTATATATPSPGPSAQPVTPAQFSYVVIQEYAHDPGAWTQGLVFADGIFYEGTGLRGQSTLRKVDPATGEVLQGIRYPDEYFAEGVAVLDDRIFQLTWQANTGFILDRETLELEGQFGYPTEGWGLTHDGERLIMSDGTPTLYFLDPATQAITGQISVQDDLGPVGQLNELEYIDGQIYANIWQTEKIAIIDPASGNVTAYIDLRGLPDEEARAELMALYSLPDDQALTDFLTSRATLNGIAYDAAADRLFVTGKLWPELYEIDLVPIEE
jgi:glutamine cyclotransferase